MIQGEYKKILFDIYDALGFTPEEKGKALEVFKKKLAFKLLKSVQGDLPSEQQEWLSQNPVPGDPKLSEIQKTVQEKYSQDDLYQISKPLFKKLLDDYVQFMSEGLDQPTADKIRALASSVRQDIDKTSK